MPLLKAAPGVSSLETVLGYRISDYASAGSFDSWKAELLYQPIDGTRIRGSYQEAVRAASVFELYQPQLPEFFFFDPPSFDDPCTAGSVQRTGPDAARVEALCIEQGLPAALLPDFEDVDGVAFGVIGGNPDLGPEEAVTTTLAWSGLRARRIRWRRTCSCRSTGIESTSPTRSMAWVSISSWRTATTPATTRISPSRTNGAGCSDATR